MNEHTPEPWETDGDTIFNSSIMGGSTITFCDREISDFPASTVIANARRIVACVNALAGIPTETLEAISPGTFIQTYDERTAQRDALLDALHTAGSEPAAFAYRLNGKWLGIDASKSTIKNYMIGGRIPITAECGPIPLYTSAPVAMAEPIAMTTEQILSMDWRTPIGVDERIRIARMIETHLTVARSLSAPKQQEPDA